MCVALMTDLEFPASDKGARISLKDVIPPLPSRYNAWLAKGGTILFLQGILGSPFPKRESCTPVARINCQGCPLFYRQLLRPGRDAVFPCCHWLKNKRWLLKCVLFLYNLSFVVLPGLNILQVIRNIRMFNRGGGKEMPYRYYQTKFHIFTNVPLLFEYPARETAPEG